ncbi:MAG: hypothetical protein ACRYGP_16590 [Janthinobacterium lividum]
MNGLDPRTIAKALKGELAGGQILAPGPGHSARDRSLSVKPDSTAPDGFTVFSHAGDDPMQCRDHVRASLGLPQWIPGQGRGAKLEYIYRDAEGRPYLRVTRTPEKKFWQHQWDGSGWIKGAPRPKIPYRLPELLAADPTAPVFICEGEKNTDAVRGLGLVATTNSEGAGKWLPDLSPYLAGRTCYVMEDNDEKGAMQVRTVSQMLADVAAEIRIVKLPNLAPKGDVEDWIRAGGDAATLLDLCRAAPVFDIGKAEAPRKAKRRDANDTRPVVTLLAGQIKDAVDAVESALIERGGLFQRANQIVHLGEAPVITADKREISAVRIFERGEHALAEDIAEAACLMKWDGRAEDYVVTNPPTWLVKTLQQRTGAFRFPVLTAVINAPTLRPDGTLLATPGYDSATGLFYDPRGVRFPTIPPRPTKADADRALADLGDLISGFPFDGPADYAVALSAILTACVRQAIRSAPMHAFSAPVAGSGKTKLVDIASVVATGREAGVIAQAPDEAEMEKRLSALFLQGAGTVAVDNCSFPVDGNFLCACLTQATVSIRPLGTSTQVTVPTNAFITATGNNLVIAGDMTRRTLVAHLDPRVERPELREFAFEPVAQAKADRVRYVTAALTILLAFKAAGSPRQSNPLGSFEDWSLLVRDALIWLGCADPVGTMERARISDPKLDELSAVLTQWQAVVGTDRITVRRVIEKATKQSGGTGYDFNPKDFDNPDFREALLAVAGQGGAINGKRLGKWLGAHAKRIAGGCWIESAGVMEGSLTWQLMVQA